jgi:hypothetical protein
MKIRNILSLLIVLAVVVNAQTGSINNTLGTGGSFIVKDGANNYLRVDQATGNSVFLRNLELGNLDNSILGVGVITRNNKRFLHNYAPNGSEFNNLFIGLEAGNFTMGGGSISYESSYNVGVGSNSLSSITTGYSNTALGSKSLLSNTIGYDNTAIGYCPLYSNINGTYNVAFGNYALFENLGGSSNTAVGYKVLKSNATGNLNSSFGYNTLQQNGIGDANSAFGSYSLYSNYAGNFNAAFGYQALYTNTGGNYNSAFGYNALFYSNGQNNTAIGYSAGSSITSGSNNICIGFDATVPSGSSDNQVRIGNTSINYAGIQVPWSVTSDRRWKENIQPTDLGLNFISKLNPVSYTRKNDDKHRSEYGLIAQELEEVLKAEGTENTGMLTVTNDGYYELRYNDLFAPIIKAIQELKNENDLLRSEVENLKLMKTQLAEIEQLKEELIKQIKVQNPEKENENLKFSSIDN